jgi:hypothetical protein
MPGRGTLPQRPAQQSTLSACNLTLTMRLLLALSCATLVASIPALSACSDPAEAARAEQVRQDSILTALTTAIRTGHYSQAIVATDSLELSRHADSVATLRRLAIDSIDVRNARAADEAHRRRQAQIDSLLTVARRVPTSNIERSLDVYAELSRLDGSNPEYKTKVDELSTALKRQRARQILRIHRFYTTEPNSAGGVDVGIVFTNPSPKTIKYLRWSAVPYNAVNDVVQDELGRGPSVSGRATGPVRPGQRYGDSTIWSNMWYNSTIVRAELRSIDIEYMDGTTASLHEDAIKLVRF